MKKRIPFLNKTSVIWIIISMFIRLVLFITFVYPLDNLSDSTSVFMAGIILLLTIIEMIFERNRIFSYYTLTKEGITHKSLFGNKLNEIRWNEIEMAGIRKNALSKYASWCPYEIYFATSEQAFKSGKKVSKNRKKVPGYMAIIYSKLKLEQIKEYYQGEIKDQELVKDITNHESMYHTDPEIGDFMKALKEMDKIKKEEKEKKKAERKQSKSNK